jgi:DNA polymerase
MPILYIDFETRSECDLPKHGVYNYAQDLTTDVLCMCYAFDDGDVQTWTPDLPFPDDVRNYAGQIRAHNATFERLIFWYVLQIDFKLAQFYCTAVQARANCLPGSLEDVGRAISSEMRKDHRGKMLVKQCCTPPFNTKLLPELIEYCRQDVRTMRAVSTALRQLTDDELADYHVNECINDAGVLVDVDLCRAAMRYASVELEEIQSRVVELTDGAIKSVRSPKMREWVLERVGSAARDLMWNGEKYSIDKSVRANLLLMDDPEEIPPHVAEVIQCADDLWASSVAKFKRLQELADVEDHRVRGAFVFNGGSATGRASSYGAQVHNFTRKCAKEPQRVRDDMVESVNIVPLHGKRVTDVLKGMLRPALIPAIGNVFVVADWAGIEARVTPWASLQLGSEAVLDVFRSGEDIYIRAAAGIFNCAMETITSDQRQIGKVAILSCGYMGGAGAFGAMGKAYGISLPEAEAKRTVDAWRRSNTWAVQYWSALERAFMGAMRHKGREFTAGRVTYLFDSVHLWYALPSGRVLCYPFARIEDGGVSYAKAAWKPAADAVEWPRARLWPGLACENITQAIANDLLRDALRRIGHTVVLHVHDEIVLEVRKQDAESTAQDLETVMCSAPLWAEGLPLAVGVSTLERYGK